MKIKTFIFNNLSIFITSLFFVFIAIYNSYIKLGLYGDGTSLFFDILCSDNYFNGFILGNNFGLPSRLFPSYMLFLTVGIVIEFFTKNIDYLIFVFTFVSYIVPAILLIIIYLNMPINQRKKDFYIILLSTLLCLMFSYQVYCDNFNAMLFFWVLFVILYYVDFDKLTIFNLFSLLIFSFFSIFSHPMLFIFNLFLLSFSIFKFIKTHKFSIYLKIIIIMVFINLLASIIVNIYYILHPVAEYSFYFIFDNIKFFPVILLILIVGLNKFKSFLYINLILIFVSILLTVYFKKLYILEEFAFTRVLVFYFTICSMFFIILKNKFKTIINFYFYKKIFLMSLLLLSFEFVLCGQIWNDRISNFKSYQKLNDTIELETLLQIFSGCYTSGNIPRLYCILSQNNSCKLITTKQSIKKFELEDIYYIKGKKEKLDKFNINLNNIVIYN